MGNTYTGARAGRARLWLLRRIMAIEPRVILLRWSLIPLVVVLVLLDREYRHIWPVELAFALSAVVLNVLASRVVRSRVYPDWFGYIFAGLNSLTIVGLIMLTGGATSAFLPLMAIGLVGHVIRFRGREGLAIVFVSLAAFAAAHFWLVKPFPVFRVLAIILLYLYLTLYVRFLASEEEHQRSMANTDALTGLFNRHFFQANVAHLIERDLPFALVLLDLDGFKKVNDIHGHAAGDSVLRQVADLLRRQVRQDDITARWGGEEFAICLRYIIRSDALQVVERIRRALANADFQVAETGDGPLRLTASFGVVMYPEDATDLPMLIERVDEVLYAAKSHGKNRVFTWRGVPVS